MTLDLDSTKQEIELLNSKSKFDLLWENPNPTSVFSTQTITIDNIENYNVIFIEAKYYMADQLTSITTMMATKTNSGCNLIINDSAKDAGGRRVYISEPSVITFENTQWGSTVYNDYIVPIRIYGIIF